MRMAVVEPRGWPPAGLRMACRTKQPELSPVPVFMTGRAFPDQAEVSAVEIAHFDFGAFRGRNPLFVVATAAGLLAVLAL